MSERPLDALAPLTVEADLDVSVDGTPLEVASTGDRLFVEVASLAAAVRLARSGSAARVRRLDGALRAADLTLEFRVRRTTVAVLGADARGGPVSRGLGVAPAEARVGSALAAAGREAVAAARTVARWLG